MSKLSRLFSAINNALNIDVDQAAANAKHMMGYYQYRFDTPDGGKYQFGDFTIMMDGREPNSPTSPLIEIGYKGERVLRHSSYVNAKGRKVTSREMSRDRSWIKPFNNVFESFQKLATAQKFVDGLAPGRREDIIYHPRRLPDPS